MAIGSGVQTVHIQRRLNHSAFLWQSRHGLTSSSFLHEPATCREGASNISSWHWRPATCDLDQIRGADVARLLEGRRIFFVGDSITMNMFASLACLLAPHISPNRTAAAEAELWRSGTIVQPCTASLKRDHALLHFNASSLCYEEGVGLNKGFGSFMSRSTPARTVLAAPVVVLRGGGVLEMLFSDSLLDASSEAVPFAPWIQVYGKTQRSTRHHSGWARRIVEAGGASDVVVINTGAHASDLDMFERAARLSLLLLRDRFQGTIVWRETYPGVPPSDLCHLNAFNGSYASPQVRGMYNWDQMASYEKVVARLGAELQLESRMHFLPVAPMMASRCDRLDPLHLCIPGQPAAWNEALLHLIKVLTESAPAQPLGGCGTPGHTGRDARL